MSTIRLQMPPAPYYITIGHTLYQPGEQHPSRQQLAVYDWLFVTEGALYIGEDDQHWTVEKGESLLLMPDRFHYASAPCATETTFYWIHFSYPGSYSIQETEAAPRPIRHAWANPYGLKLKQYETASRFSKAVVILEQLTSLASTTGKTAYWEEQKLFLELLSCYELEQEQDQSSITGPARKLAERTEAYLRKHYQEKLTNDTLAKALHFHPGYIVRCMKELYQCTPMEYLLEIRVEQAKLLLIKTEWSIAKVAEQAGFSYASYFTNCFKQRTGISPLAFRKQYSK